MPDSEVNAGIAEHAGVMAHAEGLHDHSAMMAMGHMVNESHSGDNSHSDSMPCCDDSAVCKHGHCSMHVALLGGHIQSLVQASPSKFNPYSIHILSLVYEIILPPPAV
jgi:hypothetical protein